VVHKRRDDRVLIGRALLLFMAFIVYFDYFELVLLDELLF